MAIDRQTLAQQIHAQPIQLVVATTGGGSRAISILVSTPGASRTMLAAHVPYASQALVEWLGGKPDEFCSAWTARAMAMRAFLDARRLSPDYDVCGLACTASLASDRPKRGPHRAHFAAQLADRTTAWSIELEKGRRTRDQEEDLVCDLLLNLAAEALGVPGRINLMLADGETLARSSVTAGGGQQALLADRTKAVQVVGEDQGARPTVVLPGAFNPLHAAHRQMAAIAQELLGSRAAFEISMINVDKPPLDFIEIHHRLEQFSPDESVWLTRAALYAEKATLFPGATFVVGADTIQRIGQARYYDSPQAMDEAIARIASQGCRFLVFGRRVGDEFCGLSQLDLPDSLARLCQEVSQTRFQMDLSSTELRRASSAE